MNIVTIIVEGPTEEAFVKEVLRPHFEGRLILKPIIWKTNSKSGDKGGGRNWDKVENEIRSALSGLGNKTNHYVSTMIDLYGFPLQGQTILDAEVKALPNGKQKALRLAEKMLERFHQHRFFKGYVQLHEFEALLFSDIDKLRLFFPDQSAAIGTLKASVGTTLPEDINDRPETAPSKRIESYVKAFQNQKKTAGIVTAIAIGLPTIRQKCPHFDGWIQWMESLS